MAIQRHHLCKASAAGYTCGDTANGHRHHRRRCPTRPQLPHAVGRRPWLPTRKTLSSRHWLTVIVSWSSIQETGATLTIVPCAVKRSGWYIKTKLSCCRVYRSQHLDGILQAGTMKRVDQVEYHVGSEDADDIKRRVANARRKRSPSSSADNDAQGRRLDCTE